ncbi:sensor histidine kinase [Paenibacillus dauci]|uniref:sensor histidine kinase n=1 Tax=Paenibacillus dauci TaxID=1567106 RepID=UPI000619C95A|nr:HAMP domain-containing sensor histidine kinase [Paenibacillus dauci]
MKNRSITFKLFLMTVLFFVCFYGMVILSQLLFFNNFYEEHKVNKAENDLERLAAVYTKSGDNYRQMSNEVLKFMNRNKSQLTIVNMDGQMVLEDPFHLILRKDNGQKVSVSLSLYMNLNEDSYRALNIRTGDKLDLWGNADTKVSQSQIVFTPEQIEKHQPRTASYMPDISGTVTEMVLPTPKNWNQRQGLLMEALYRAFPLSDSQQEQLLAMKPLQYEWTESWSGTHNVIMIQPVKRSNQEVELLFALTSLQEISDTTEALRWFYLYLGIGGFILILILSLFFSKIITRPLIALNAMAKRIVKLDFSVDAPPVRQNDELGSLASSMYTMSISLDRALRELQEANQQLQQDMEQKQKIEMMQQSFFTNASHELKTPLSIVKSFAEGLQDGVNINKQDHYISVIIEEADKMEMLIKDMLDLARLESGTIRLHTTSFMLSELTEKVADRLVHLLQARKLEIMIIPVNELPVLADPDWIEQVIRNFIVNAIRHADEGSTIVIEMVSEPHSTRFSVENKGEPIPEDQLAQIWERFYRGEASRNRQTGGTGLGLSISRQILDLHGFRYEVHNREKGVCFSIIFER